MNWSSVSLQIKSTEDLFKRPDIAGPAFGLLKRANAMGLLAKPVESLDLPVFRRVVESIRRTGIAGEAAREVLILTDVKMGTDVDADELRPRIEVLVQGLEESPVPPSEWRRLTALFRHEREELAELLDLSLSSLRRYSAGERETPDAVAGRLHFLALLVGDLAGAYNDTGVRAWFRRKRALLDGKAPGDLLHGNWQPGDPDPERVRALGRSLAAGSAT
jgi:hypothetical protein